MDNRPPDTLISAIVLAAGQSSRLAPYNKLTRDFGGTSMLQLAIDATRVDGIHEVLLIVGPGESTDPAQHRDDPRLRRIVNPTARDGLSSSVRCGIDAVSKTSAAAIILLADMPFVTAAHVQRLIDAFHEGGSKHIIVPKAQGRRGNPILWPQWSFKGFAGLRGDVGARSLLQQYPDDVRFLDMPDDGVLVDIDTPESWLQHCPVTRVSAPTAPAVTARIKRESRPC